MDTRDKSSTTAPTAGTPPRHGRFRHSTCSSQITESLLDRLINTSHQVFMNGPSYRPNKRPGRAAVLRCQMSETCRKLVR
jgi:hypothetical protein